MYWHFTAAILLCLFSLKTYCIHHANSGVIVFLLKQYIQPRNFSHELDSSLYSVDRHQLAVILQRCLLPFMTICWYLLTIPWSLDTWLTIALKSKLDTVYIMRMCLQCFHLGNQQLSFYSSTVFSCTSHFLFIWRSCKLCKSGRSEFCHLMTGLLGHLHKSQIPVVSSLI